jgi:hypothetical protein
MLLLFAPGAEKPLAMNGSVAGAALAFQLKKLAAAK